MKEMVEDISMFFLMFLLLGCMTLVKLKFATFCMFIFNYCK